MTIPSPKRLSGLRLAALSALLLLPAIAAGQSTTPPVDKRELIFCADRMTPEEREAYRNRMRATRSEADKEALRTAHRDAMQARAVRDGQGPCAAPGRRAQERLGQ